MHPAVADTERAEVEARLRALSPKQAAERDGDDGASVIERIQSANADEILDLIDAELGTADGDGDLTTSGADEEPSR